jgi:DNA-binding NarL/FixJ family response regulator
LFFVLTTVARNEYVYEAMKCGASGFLLRTFAAAS